HRYWFAIASIALPAIVSATVWYLPGDDPSRTKRAMVFQACVMAAILLFSIWALFLSRFPLLTKVSVLVLGLAIGPIVLLASVKSCEFDGDMMPIFKFRWQAQRERDLAEHFAAQARAAAAQTSLKIETPLPDDYPEYRNRHRDGLVTGP